MSEIRIRANFARCQLGDAFERGSSGLIEGHCSHCSDMASG